MLVIVKVFGARHNQSVWCSSVLVLVIIKVFWFWFLQELLSHRKQGPGFLSRMSETMRAVANSVRGLKSRPEEFSQMQEYVEEFSNKIYSVDKVTQRIIKEQKGTTFTQCSIFYSYCWMIFLY